MAEIFTDAELMLDMRCGRRCTNCFTAEPGLRYAGDGNVGPFCKHCWDRLIDYPPGGKWTCPSCLSVGFEPRIGTTHDDTPFLGCQFCTGEGGV